MEVEERERKEKESHPVLCPSTQAYASSCSSTSLSLLLKNNLPLSNTFHPSCMHEACPTLCDPTGHSPPGSSVHGILQARILTELPCPPPGDLPDPGIGPMSASVPALQAVSLPLSHHGSLFHPSSYCSLASTPISHLKWPFVTSSIPSHLPKAVAYFQPWFSLPHETTDHPLLFETPFCWLHQLPLPPPFPRVSFSFSDCAFLVSFVGPSFPAHSSPLGKVVLRAQSCASLFFSPSRVSLSLHKLLIFVPWVQMSDKSKSPAQTLLVNSG